MFRVLGIGLLVLTASGSALGQNRPAKTPQTTPATAQEYSQLKNVSEVIGRLSNVDTGGGGTSITLDVPYQAPATGPNAAARKQNYQNQLNNLQRQYQAAMRGRNAVSRQQQLMQIAMRMQQVRMLALAASMTIAFKQFDLDTTDKLVVRRLTLPFEYDNKGYPKKRTKEELDQLRGKDKTLPGFEASALDLQNGQTVKVFFSRSQPEPKLKDVLDADKKPSKDGKGKKTANRPADVPQVRMILIVADPADNASQNQPARKNKR